MSSDDMTARQALKESHQKEKIKARLKNRHNPDYLKDTLLGGIDGGISTFAIVAGTIGGGFPAIVALALGIASLVADGLSMAASNFQATKSLGDKLTQIRKDEAFQIEQLPEGEKEEVRLIFAEKGFEGDLLDQIVAVITKDKKRWIDTMVQEEFGMPLKAPNPYIAAVMTYMAFLIVGLIPLLPFFWAVENLTLTFVTSCTLTGIAFVIVGILKGLYLKSSLIKEAVEVLVLGSVAAVSSYYISHWITLYLKG